MRGPRTYLRDLKREAHQISIRERCDRAVQLHDGGDNAGAVKLLDETLGHYPTSIRARGLRMQYALPPDARVALAMERSEAEYRYRQIVEDHPESALGLLHLASTILPRGDDAATREACALAKRAVELEPTDPGCLAYAASICRWADFAATREFARRARALASKAPDRDWFEYVHGPDMEMLEGLILMQDRQWSAGMEHLRRAYEREPDLANPAHVYATHLALFGRRERALEVISSALEKKQSPSLIALREEILAGRLDGGSSSFDQEERT
jgi:predicted Zn-dependent protease